MSWLSDNKWHAVLLGAWALAFGGALVGAYSWAENRNIPRASSGMSSSYKADLASTAAGMNDGAALARSETASGAMKKTDAALRLMAKSAAASAGRSGDDMFERAFVREYSAEWNRLR